MHAYRQDDAETISNGIGRTLVGAALPRTLSPRSLRCSRARNETGNRVLKTVSVCGGCGNYRQHLIQIQYRLCISDIYLKIVSLAVEDITVKVVLFTPYIIVDEPGYLFKV